MHYARKSGVLTSVRSYVYSASIDGRANAAALRKETPPTMPANDQVQKYYDALIASYDILTERLEALHSYFRGLFTTSRRPGDNAAEAS